MYNILNNDERYFITYTETGKTREIGNIHDLAIEVASMLYNQFSNTFYWLKKKPWTEHDWIVNSSGKYDANVFTKQNLTGNDSILIGEKYTKIVFDDLEDPKKPRYVTAIKYSRILKPYRFHNYYGSTFDVRNISSEIKRILVNGELNNVKDKSCSNRRSIRRFSGCHSHVSVRYSHKFGIREQLTKISCEEQGVKYRRKALPQQTYGWDDETTSRRSAGWKDHKYKKQWNHNVVNKKQYHKMASRNYNRDVLLNEELEILNELYYEDMCD